MTFFGQFTWLHRILLIIIHALTYSLPQCDVATFLSKTVSLLKRQKGKCLDLCLMCLGQKKCGVKELALLRYNFIPKNINFLIDKIFPDLEEKEEMSITNSEH